MAMFPCDVTGHRYRGAQQTIYPAIVEGQIAVRRKLRLCDRHFVALTDQLAVHCQNAQMDFDEVGNPPCGLCDEPVTQDTAQFFATVYAKGAEREDWWAPVHHDCVSALMDDWLLTADMA